MADDGLAAALDPTQGAAMWADEQQAFNDMLATQIDARPVWDDAVADNYQAEIDTVSDDKVAWVTSVTDDESGFLATAATLSAAETTTDAGGTKRVRFVFQIVLTLFPLHNWLRPDARNWLRFPARSQLNNHFHLVLRPHNDGDLSRWMQWLLTSHVRRYHRHYHSSGHVWQGRFKAFPVQDDDHLLTVIRYVERNPLRANLVKQAELWPWSSLAWRVSGKRPEIFADWPIACPAGWLKRVNRPQSEAEEKALRRAIERGQPFGAESWVEDIAQRLDLESTVRPRGRPRKTEK